VAELLESSGDIITTCRAGCGKDYLPTKTVVSLAAFALCYPLGLTCDPCRYAPRVLGDTPCRSCVNGICSICTGLSAKATLKFPDRAEVPCTCNHQQVP